MRLVTIHGFPEGRCGALIGDEVLDFGLSAALFPLAAWVPASLKAVLGAGTEGMELIQRLVRAAEHASDAVRDDLRGEGALTSAASTRLMAPVPDPGILLSHGRAYHSHVQEMSRGAPAGAPGIPKQPIGFMKNANSIIGHGAAIRLPAAAPSMVDFEGEISVVFARPCHGVEARDALAHVLGVTIVNDVSARDWVAQIDTAPDLNRMGKQFAGFSPMGPCIATLDEIADPANMHIVTRVNGEVMQDAWTSDLIWCLPELIAFYSRWYPFKAGDVLTTGTPSGVGYGRDPRVFLKPGDTVAITVDGVGELSNPIAAAGHHPL